MPFWLCSRHYKTISYFNYVRSSDFCLSCLPVYIIVIKIK